MFGLKGGSEMMDFLFHPYADAAVVGALVLIGVGYTLWRRRHQS
jgi:hypothetical protein